MAFFHRFYTLTCPLSCFARLFASHGFIVSLAFCTHTFCFLIFASVLIDKWRCQATISTERLASTARSRCVLLTPPIKKQRDMQGGARGGNALVYRERSLHASHGSLYRSLSSSLHALRPLATRLPDTHCYCVWKIGTYLSTYLSTVI